MNSFGSLSLIKQPIKVLESIEENIIVADPNYNIIWINPKAADLLKNVIPLFDIKTLDDLIGINMSHFHKEPEYQREIMRNLTDYHRARINIKNHYIADIVINPIWENKTIIGYVVMLMDVTTRVQEEERKNRIIQELSAPILHMWDRTYVIPLIGIVDNERFEIILYKLLKHCGNREIDFFIIDFSGVNEWNGAIPFNDMITSLWLMGISPIIVGIKPELAPKLMIDSSKVKTFVTSNAAIKYIVSKQQQ